MEKKYAIMGISKQKEYNMFSDTLTLTINSVAKNLVRINQDNYSSEYFLRETDGEFRMKIRNTSYVDKARNGLKVDRHNVEVVHMLYPISPSTVPTIRKTYAVFENQQGDVLATVGKTVVGSLAFLTEPNVVKMLNLES